MKNIQRVSQLLQVVLIVLAVGVLLSYFIGWVILPSHISVKGISLSVLPHYVPITHPISAQDKVVGFIVSLLPMMATIAVIGYLVLLFGLYAKGVIFDLQNVRIFNRIGRIMVGWCLLGSPIYQVLISLVLTIHNPPGHRMIMIHFAGSDLLLVIGSAMVWVMAWVMQEGVYMADEHKRII